MSKTLQVEPGRNSTFCQKQGGEDSGLWRKNLSGLTEDQEQRISPQRHGERGEDNKQKTKNKTKAKSFTRGDTESAEKNKSGIRNEKD